MPVPPSSYPGGNIVYVTVTKRNPEPQDSQCDDQEMASGDAKGELVPFGQLLSYGTDGSPTITITKTLFSSAEVTSTTTTGSSTTSGSTATTTTTGTSTVFNTVTVTSISTTSVTVSSSSSSSSSSDLSSSTGTSTSKTTGISGSNNSTDPGGAHQGKVAGSVIGSFACFGMIGFLIWYFCTKKSAGSRFKAKLNIKRRKSSSARSPKTPQLEDQTSNKAQSVMLEQVRTGPTEEHDLNAFLAPSAHLQEQDNAQKTSPMVTRKPVPSELPGSPGFPLPRPSWIGMAVSTSTPPNTPPLPRSNSQKTNRSMAPSVGTIEDDSDMYGPPKEPPYSLVPAPLKPPTKPAPIVTTPQIERSNTISPLSPRAMMSAVGNTGSRMWHRASQALSPSGYQKMPFDRDNSSYAGSKGRKDSAASNRNPQLEIGAQTDHEHWI